MGSELTKRALAIWWRWMWWPVLLVGAGFGVGVAELAFFSWFGFWGGLGALFASVAIVTFAIAFGRASLAKEGKSDD